MKQSPFALLIGAQSFLVNSSEATSNPRPTTQIKTPYAIIWICRSCYRNLYLTRIWVQWYLVRIYSQEKKRQEGIAHLGKKSESPYYLIRKSSRIEKHAWQQVCILIRLQASDISAVDKDLSDKNSESYNVPWSLESCLQHRKHQEWRLQIGFSK